ncbi:hypothetical protein Tco_0520189 [Tanacetum coccineum]
MASKPPWQSPRSSLDKIYQGSRLGILGTSRLHGARIFFVALSHNTKHRLSSLKRNTMKKKTKRERGQDLALLENHAAKKTAAKVHYLSSRMANVLFCLERNEI